MYTYDYLLGTIIMGMFWLIGFLYRKDLRKPMLWSGFFYAFVLSFGFLLVSLTGFFHAHSPAREIVPGYWNPESMFNLDRLTHGWAIEDVLFMFFIGGIAAYVYEVAARKRIRFKKRPEVHLKALAAGAIAAFVIGAFTGLNYMYGLIAFGLGGAIVIWQERKDLVTHSIAGGLILVVVYFFGFELFNLIFPHFISQFYSLRNVSGVFVLGIPLEEYLYAFTFGLMWAPLYEYEHGEKDVALAPVKIS